jgi:SAM-dependent methyltransferase
MQHSDTLREWTESASYWAEHSPTIRQMFAPLTLALIEESAIAEGQSVLDVAGGPGEPSLTIAQVVGPTGSVTCTDAVAEMVAAAEAEARKRRLKNIRFRQCKASALPFPDSTFDATVSRLGAMFFPEEAFREILRVTKPGGVIAFAVWHKAELNPFSYIVTNVVSRHVDAPPADPDAPGAFRFAESGKLAGMLKNVGASDVRERIFKFDIAAPISPGEFWAMRSAISESLRTKLKSLSEAEKSQVAKEVFEAVRDFFPDNQMKFPAQMLLVSGRKP